MVGYEDWNRALVSYFISGVSLGTKIYLSIDRDVLERIGQTSLSSSTARNWNEYFRAAVRERVLCRNYINLVSLQGRDSSGLPKCVAFLGLCVLAANQMANEDKISELNYFKRLREILQVSNIPKSSRPQGMKLGYEAEEPLWKEWNLWLLEKGFQPTAYQGDGPQKFITYPISQCLLRQADKERLQVLFIQKQWKATWDAQTLLTQVRREAQGLSSHLQELIKDRHRHEAVAEAIHEVYQQWQVEGSPTVPKASSSQRNWVSNLYSGLYRTEDPFLGQVQYYLYPKQQRGRQLESIQVERQNSTQILSQERAGWYLPIGEPLTVQVLERGVRCVITSSPDLNQLILPVRDFWLLLPDPDNPDSDIYASWGTPELGTPFILLGKQELLKDLERLRDEHLLEWSGEPQPVDERTTWIELNHCMVISQAWDGVFINNQALKDALQPTVKLSISLSGGLRVPPQRGWLEGYPPQVTIFGFFPKAQLQVINLLDEKVILERSQKTNQSMPLDLPRQGTYLIKATYAGESAERLIRILSWESFEIVEPDRREFIFAEKKYSICGSVIQEVS